MERLQKRISDSFTEQVHGIMPMHLNGSNRLFGGQLALWIDEVAGIAAMRHCGTHITTLSIDNLIFREPVFQKELLVLRGKVTFVGNTSLEVRVDSYVENLSGVRKLINTAFVTQVALGDDGKPCTVPGLICDNEFEKKEFDAGKIRREMRIKLSKEVYC